MLKNNFFFVFLAHKNWFSHKTFQCVTKIFPNFLSSIFQLGPTDLCIQKTYLWSGTEGQWWPPRSQGLWIVAWCWWRYTWDCHPRSGQWGLWQRKSRLRHMPRCWLCLCVEQTSIQPISPGMWNTSSSPYHVPDTLGSLEKNSMNNPKKIFCNFECITCILKSDMTF